MDFINHNPPHRPVQKGPLLWNVYTVTYQSFHCEALLSLLRFHLWLLLWNRTLLSLDGSCFTPSSASLSFSTELNGAVESVCFCLFFLCLMVWEFFTADTASLTLDHTEDQSDSAQFEMSVHKDLQSVCLWKRQNVQMLCFDFRHVSCDLDFFFFLRPYFQGLKSTLSSSRMSWLEVCSLLQMWSCLFSDCVRRDVYLLWSGDLKSLLNNLVSSKDIVVLKSLMCCWLHSSSPL